MGQGLANPNELGKNLWNAVRANEKKITKALADQVPASVFLSFTEQAIRGAVLRGDTRLLQCTPSSVMRALLQIAQAGLTPNGVAGEAYVVPSFSRNSGAWQAEARFGYRGLMRLARRGSKLGAWSARGVRAGDLFEVDYGSEERLVHRPKLRTGDDDGGELIAAYSVVTLGTGERSFHVVDQRDIHLARSMSGNPKESSSWSDTWSKWEGAMAAKTAVRAHTKYLPISETAATLIAEEAERESGRSVTQLDDEPENSPEPKRNALEGLEGVPVGGDA